MAGIVHAKVSTVADGSTTDHVRPSDWNADHSITGAVILSSGTATNVPLQFVTGALNTVATAGAVEYDGLCFFKTPVTGARALTQTFHACSQTTTRTLATSTINQKIFNETTNGAVTLKVGTYFWRMGFAVTFAATVNHPNGYGLAAGTATIQKQANWVWMSPTSSFAIPASVNLGYITAVTTNQTGTTRAALCGQVKGKVVISASGTVIPSMRIAAGNATAATLTDAYVYFWPAGTTDFGTVGAWT
jgi:hypothetical protein